VARIDLVLPPIRPGADNFNAVLAMIGHDLLVEQFEVGIHHAAVDGIGSKLRDHGRLPR
jgi:hypothetical protein